MSAKQAGSRFEREVADYLAEKLEDDRIDRRVKMGANDRGDIAGLRTISGGRVVAEVKNVSRLSLGQWVTESQVERGNDDAAVGVVIHKRHGVGAPGRQYVTMELDDFIVLLRGGLRSEPIVLPDPHTEVRDG